MVTRGAISTCSHDEVHEIQTAMHNLARQGSEQDWRLLTFIGPGPVLAALLGVDAAGASICIGACCFAIEQRRHVDPLRRAPLDALHSAHACSRHREGFATPDW